jgi:N-methylhydantoinase A
VDLAWTHLGRLGGIDWGRVQDRLGELETQAREMLVRGGADVTAAKMERRVDMRYVGQGYEVPVPLPDGDLESDVDGHLRSAFNRLYRERFGTSLETAAVECVHWRLTATVTSTQGELRFQSERRADALKGERKAYFREMDAYISCPVFDRYELTPNGENPGPALIEERESTIVVGPSAKWRVDALGNVVVAFGQGPEAGPRRRTTRSGGRSRS